MCLHSYLEFGEKEEGKYRILDMETGGANRDGAALLYMAEKMVKRKEKMKILIFFCDGRTKAAEAETDYFVCGSDWKGSGGYSKYLRECLYQCGESGTASASDCKETFRIHGIEKQDKGLFQVSFLIGGIMEQKKEWIEDFWRTGYAIRLGKDQYFQEIRNKRIVTAKIWKAAFFQSLREAEIFAQKHLWYTGMDPQICYRAWVLVSIESEEEQELFWNGKQFVPELGKAKLFSSSQEMQTYVKRLGLSRQTYPELLPVEKKQMKNAA